MGRESMNRYIPLALCLILAASMILLAPVQVFALTTTLQNPSIPFPASPLLFINSTVDFMLTDFRFYVRANDSFVDINSTLTSVKASTFMYVIRDSNYKDSAKLWVDYDITLNGVSAHWQDTTKTEYLLKIGTLTLKGSAIISNNQTLITATATAPLWAIIKERFV